MLFTPTISHAHVQSGLVGWWKFDEASGNAADSSGYANTGTPTGTTIVSNCKRGGCRSFNGTSDFIDVGTNLTVTSDVTVSYWAYLSSISGYRMAMTRTSGTGGDWEIAMSANGNSEPYYGRNGSTIFPTNYGITTNRWLHFTLTIDSVAGAKIYINGTSVATSVEVTSFRNANGTLYIGKRSDGYYFNGLLDDIRVYNRALTAVEVMDLYKAGSVISGAVIGGGKINQ